jgi:hypothetical protein
MAKFWANNLKEEVGVVLGFNESNYPYKISNVFEKEDPYKIWTRLVK